MTDYTCSSELFLSELLRISSNIVWKDPKKVQMYESNVDSIEVEQYKLAVQGKLTFDLVYKFDVDALINAGIDPYKAQYYSDDSDGIPEEFRNICTQKQMEYILENYNEENDYYRMLNGLPALEDNEYFYNTEYPDISDGLTPIHKLDISQLYQLESVGFIEKLIEDNPDKKYLNFLTDKKISIYTARQAADFSILWMESSGLGNLQEDFKEVYNSCRYMTMNVYYSKTFNQNNPEYTGYIGMNILFMTIMQMMHRFLDTDITRDFYDEESIRLIYDSYGVPFYSAIPMEYHKKIVKNMNILMSHKGSTNVFYDLFDVFGFSDMSVFEFYMFKKHRFENGKPIFVKDEDGNYDLEKMYEIDFAKVTLYNDPMNEMMSDRNHVEYEKLTEPDPYWFDTKDLREKIFSEEYNFMESKYLGIQTTFNLMKILYECTYYLKMIIDNRALLNATFVYNNAIKRNCNIFDLVIYTCDIVCKMYGFEGNIPSSPHSIGKVMGFNFKDDLITLKENITKDDYLKNDTQLLTYLETMNVDSLASIEKVYGNMTELRMYLSNKMADTDIPDEYWAYYNLYNTLMYSEYVNDVFSKTDGTTAESFSDLLKEINPELYKRIHSSSESVDLATELSDSLYLLKSSCTHLKNIQYADNINIDTIIEYLFKLLDFFKSAKADLTGYEIVYSLVSRTENIMKLMNMIDRIYDNHRSDPQYSIFDDLTDLLDSCFDMMTLRDNIIEFLDQHVSENNVYYLSLIAKLDDYIKTISHVVKDLSDEFDFVDYMHGTSITKLPDNYIGFDDRVNLLYDEVMEVIKYIIYDNHYLYSQLVRITELSGLRNDENKMQFLTKLAVLYIEHVHSDIAFDDSLTEKAVKQFMESENRFNDILVKTFFKYKEKTNADIQDVITHTIESKKAGHSEYSLIDEMSINDIEMLNSLIKENHFTILSDIITHILSEFIDDIMIMGESLVHKEKDTERLSEFRYVQSMHCIFSKENSYSNGSLSDKLFLKKETVYDE